MFFLFQITAFVLIFFNTGFRILWVWCITEIYKHFQRISISVQIKHSHFIFLVTWLYKRKKIMCTVLCLSRLCLHSQHFNIETPTAHQSFTFKFSKEASLISGDYDVLEVKTLSAATNNLEEILLLIYPFLIRITELNLLNK